MNPRLKHVLLQALPPYVVTVAKRVRALRHRTDAGPADKPPGTLRGLVAPEPPEWESVPDSDEAWTKPAGWTHASVAQRQRQNWPAFLASLEDTRPFGWRDFAPNEWIDVNIHNLIMTFGYVLGVASAGRNSLSVLDWGGGLGQYGRYAAVLRPDLALHYTVKDVTPLCEVGREVNPTVEFSDDDDALSRRYDLVFASASLQYARDLDGLLVRLCGAADRYLMVTRTPFVEKHDSFVVLQRPHRYGYDTEYAGWFINRKQFTDVILGCGFTLQREFMLSERPFVPNAPEQCVCRGFLFKRNEA